MSLWLFYVKHSVWIYIYLTNSESGISPMEHFNQSQSEHCELLHDQVWGRTVFFLVPNLKKDQKLPKLSRVSCIGQCLGF